MTNPLLLNHLRESSAADTIDVTYAQTSNTKGQTLYHKVADVGYDTSIDHLPQGGA